MTNKLDRIARSGLVILLVLAFSGPYISPDESPGELSASHAHLSGPDCSVCHSKPGEADAGKCLSCHNEIKSRIQQKKGFHRDKTEECGACHTEHRGNSSRLAPMDEKNFDHSETGHIHRGQHKKVDDCRVCHSPSRVFGREKTLSYLLRNSDCSGCHKSPHPGFREHCSSCHDDGTWFVDNWEHR